MCLAYLSRGIASSFLGRCAPTLLQVVSALNSLARLSRSPECKPLLAVGKVLNIALNGVQGTGKSQPGSKFTSTGVLHVFATGGKPPAISLQHKGNINHCLPSRFLLTAVRAAGTDGTAKRHAFT